jgi:hypothetical protein
LKDVAGWKSFVLFAAILCGNSNGLPVASGQEKPAEDLVKLPELSAYRLPKDEYLIFNSRFGHDNAEFIRALRKVPAVHPEGTPTSLLFEKYLHRKSAAIETDSCYIETDWLSPEELAVVASVVRQAIHFTTQLVRRKAKDPIKLIIARKQEDYYALVDAWAETDRAKREARSLSSTVIGEYRCGFRKEALEVVTLAAADSVCDNVEPYLFSQKAFREGLHTYLTSFLTLGYEHYFSTDATTPAAKRESGIELLYQTAREILSRPRHESLESVLRSDLNSINPERLAIAFALIHFILETKRDKWDTFLTSLENESSEYGKLKGPEGLWNALSKAMTEAFGLNIVELEKALQEFVTKHYLYTEEIASLIGVDRECAESSFQGFVKICELKRLKKPVSEKGEKLYQEILGKIDKKLQKSGEKF